MLYIEYRLIAETNIDPEIIKGRLINKLTEEKGYRIEEASDNNVEFRNTGWRPRHEVFGVVDGGVLEIEPGEKTKIVFTYHQSPWTEIFLGLLCLVGALSNSFKIAFFIIPIFGFFILRKINVESVGREVFNHILGIANNSNSQDKNNE